MEKERAEARIAELKRQLEADEGETAECLAALENSKHRPLSAFLYALGIPNVGIKTAKDLAREFGTFEAVRSADKTQLSAINDIGEIVADGIVAFFRDGSIAQQIDRLLALGVHPQEIKLQNDSELSLKGLTVVITGTLASLSRREAEALVEANGGKAAGSVSKNTSFVVVGENAGSKADKAQALGIPMLSESEFLKRIGK